VSVQGQKTLVFGVPDCGKVCSEQHVPEYLAQADKLRQLGITQILCVAVGDPSAAQQWAETVKVDPSKVRAMQRWDKAVGALLNEAGLFYQTRIGAGCKKSSWDQKHVF
jgi:peroxiredoxin